MMNVTEALASNSIFGTYILQVVRLYGKKSMLNGSDLRKIRERTQRARECGALLRPL